MNRIGALTLALCLLCSLALTGCGKKKETGKDVLVTVNGRPIKTQDLQIAWNSMPDEQRKSYNSPKGIINLLDELVSYKRMEIEAENRKLDQDPLFIKSMEIYRQRLLVNALIEQSMSDADLMNFFQSNFLRARFIRAAFPDGATDAQKAAAKAKADQALAFLAGGGSFDDGIKKFSDLKPGETGDMGYFTHQVIENMTNFAGADTLFNLKEPGQHTGIVESKDGWYIFELVEPPGKLDVRGLTPALASAIRDDRREQVIRSLATELKSRKEFKTVRNQDNLDDLMKALEKNWAQISGGSTVEPGAAPVPGVPAPAAPTTPAAGTTAGSPAPAAPAPALAPTAPVPAAPAPAPAAPAPAASVPAPAVPAPTTPQAP